MRLSHVLGRRVVDTAGRHLGHVFDVEVEWRANALQVTALLVGVRGLLDRLGYPALRERRSKIPWKEVRVLEAGRVVVEASGRR